MKYFLIALLLAGAAITGCSVSDFEDFNCKAQYYTHGEREFLIFYTSNGWGGYNIEVVEITYPADIRPTPTEMENENAD